MLIFSIFFEIIAKFSKDIAFIFHFPKKGCINVVGIYDKKSTILDAFVKKLWHKNNIKRGYPGHYSIFYVFLEYNTFYVDQLVHRGYTVLVRLIKSPLAVEKKF